jgi:hypothetical protein
MPKFGQTWFAGELFGDKKCVACNFKTTIHRIPLGMEVRGRFRLKDYQVRRSTGDDISQALIFRVRPGNGYMGAKVGERYQDKYRYFVPASINNVQGAAARAALAQAVYNWRFVLDPVTKKEYHAAAARKQHMSGYNLYVGAYVKAHA